MYVTRAQRFLCYVLLIPITIMVVLLSMLVIHEPRDTSGIVITIAILLFVAAFPVGLIVAYFRSGAWRTRYQRDILKDYLQVTTVAEFRGVQWTLLAFPDRVAAPAVTVVTLFLQNAHDTPRTVTVRLQESPLQRTESVPIRQRLEGGEVGVLRLALSIPSTAPAGKHEIPVSVDVDLSGKAGARVIRRPGLSPGRVYLARRVEIEVLGAHKGATVNEAALGWTPFQRIFVTGQVEPDLEAVRVLESL